MNAARCVADRAATIGQCRQDDAERQHRLQTLAGRQYVARVAETDAVPEQTAHRPPRRCERGLARAVAGEPGAQHAGDGAVEVGDGGEQRRPRLARRPLVRAVEAAWDGSAARADRAHPRCRGCADRWPQASRGSAWPRRTAAAPPRAIRSGPVVVLASEPWYCCCGRLRNRRASSSTSRKVWSRQVWAIRSSRSPCSPRSKVDPMPGSARAAVRPGQPHHEAAARRVVHVADAPCVAFAAAIREVFAAHRLGVLREAAGQLGGGSHVTRPPARRSAAADSAPSAWPAPRRRARRWARTF